LETSELAESTRATPFAGRLEKRELLPISKFMTMREEALLPPLVIQDEETQLADVNMPKSIINLVDAE